MDSKKIILAVIGLATALAAAAQNVSDLILSEAVPCNTQGVTDGYGRHTGWVEIANTSQGTVNFGGCFLTDDRTRPQRYMIPKGDASTRLGPRQVTLLWCSGNADEGTYYTNFTLSPGGTVYLVSNDGKTFIDSLSIPAALPADMAVRKVARDNKKMDFRTESEPAVPSPMTMNTVDRPARMDPHPDQRVGRVCRPDYPLVDFHRHRPCLYPQGETGAENRNAEKRGPGRRSRRCRHRPGPGYGTGR